MKIVTSLTCFSMVMVLAACATRDNSTGAVSVAAARVLSVSEHSLTLVNGSEIAYKVGDIEVPERRYSLNTNMISVEFHYFERSGESGDSGPPIYWLRGGPGFSGLSEYLERPGYYEAYIAPLLKAASVVVVGQRGFGSSSDTPCPDLPEASLVDVDERGERLARFRQGALACRDHYLNKNVDLSGYTVRELSNDVADIARSLEHRSIQLLGSSFGSHAAMTIIRDYPDLVARATLSALEGPDHTFDLPSDLRRAMQRIAADARERSSALTSLGEAGSLNEFERLIARADTRPIVVEVTDAETEQAMSLRIDGDALRSLARGTSRGTQWRHLLDIWPEDIANMLSGDFAGAARRLQYVWRATDVPNAAYFSMECSSGLSDTRRHLMNDPDGLRLFSIPRLLAAEVCRSWPADLGVEFRAGFQSAVPVVLIHGDWDTSTSFENAASVRDMFSNHHFVLVEQGSHGAMIEAQESDASFERALTAWMRSAETQSLPESVTLPQIDWR